MPLTKKEILLALRHPKIIPYSFNKPKAVQRLVEAELILAQKQWKNSLKTAHSLEEIIQQAKVHWTFQQTILYFVCRHLTPKIVVETGVDYGTSSAFILQALEDNGVGMLYSIDLPGVEYTAPFRNGYTDLLLPKNVKTGFAVPSKLKARWKLILGDAKKELPPLLDNLGNVDLFFHDSMHTYEHMMFEYDTAFNYLKDGSILANDDIHWNLAFDDFCKNHRLTPLKCYAKGFAVINNYPLALGP